MTDTDLSPDQQPASDQPASSDFAGTQADGLVQGSESAAADTTAAATEDPAGVSMDDWAAAFAEQDTSSEPAPASSTADVQAPAAAATAAATASPVAFQPLTPSGQTIGHDIDFIKDVPVQLTVELGRTRMTIKNLLQLGQGSVVELNGLAGEPMDVFVNGFLIAQGEVVVVEDRYGIRLTDIITPSERLSRLNNRR
ncbi:flagellar motor switch protein FliN [Alcaligenaceae bacterium SJ-26]|nr:flagellar motor switch protein FliN [Alcaligenaceae bacterium SJ-26]